MFQWRSAVGVGCLSPVALALSIVFWGLVVGLVGVAAHGVDPVSVRGRNGCRRDVAALVDVLTDARRRGEDIGSPQVLIRSPV